VNELMQHYKMLLHLLDLYIERRIWKWPNLQSST